MPGDAQGWFDEGQRHLGLSRHADTHSEYVGDLEDAVAAFARALALDPRHEGATVARAQTLAALHRYDEALDGLVAALELRPKDPALHRTAGQCLRELSRPEAALRAFEAVLEALPADPEARYGCACALSALRRDEQAVAAWDAVLALSHNLELDLHGRKARVLTHDFRRTEARVERACALGRLGRAGARAAWLELLETDAPGLVGPFAPTAFKRALEESEAVAEACWTYLEGAPDEAARWRWGQAVFHAAGFADDVRAVTARLESIEAGPWRLMGRDTFAREDYRVGEYATRAEAEAALAERQRRVATSQDSALRDEFWLERVR